jgi:hypothetical protein
MKIIEIIADTILTMPIMEMARKRADAIKVVESKQRPLNQHLIKCFYFDYQSKNHWISEISGFIMELDDIYLKPNDRRLPQNIYYDILYNQLFGHGVQVIKKWLMYFTSSSYSNTRRTGLTIEQVSWCLNQFYIWLCPLLEKDLYEQEYYKNNNVLYDKIIELLNNV